jgi:hypothetical protein
VYETLQQAREEHNNPVKCRLVKDRLDPRSPIIAPQKRHRISDEHRLADDERRKCRKHEAADRHGIIGEQQICRRHDEIEPDKKEYCRRQCFPRLVQQPSANPARRPGSCLYRTVKLLMVVIKRDGLAPHDNTCWLVGMVTTGADPFIPVSVIENSSMSTPNVVFAAMSLRFEPV